MIQQTTEPQNPYLAIDAEKASSDYMLLWAPLPDPEPDDDAPAGPLKWRELGWVKAHDADRAKQAGVDAVRSSLAGDGNQPAPHPQRDHFEKALAQHGLKLRAIARRGWVDEDQIGETRVVPNPQLVIG